MSADVSASTLLVIDDSQPIRQMLGLTLERLGYRCSCCEGAAEAFHLLESFVPDLVLLDLNMPGLNGLEALPRLRTLTCAPILAMTADASLIEDEGWRQKGFDGLLAKPLSVQGVVEALTRYGVPPR